MLGRVARMWARSMCEAQPGLPFVAALFTLRTRAGLEPFQLFNVVQFMMYDRSNCGSVTVDETMTMLYARYGKDRLESEMKVLFGEDLKADGDGSLTFVQYLNAVNVRLPKSSGKKKATSRRKRK